MCYWQWQQFDHSLMVICQIFKSSVRNHHFDWCEMLRLVCKERKAMKADIVKMQKVNTAFSEYPKMLQQFQEQTDAIAKRINTMGTLEKVGYELQKQAEDLSEDIQILNAWNICLEQCIMAYAAREDSVLQFLEESEVVNQEQAVTWNEIPNWAFEILG
jgi:hypothetical protein